MQWVLRRQNIIFQFQRQIQQPVNIPNSISPFWRLGGYYFTFTATTRSPLSRNLSLRIIGTKPCFPRLYYHCTYASWLSSGSWSWPCCKKLVIWLMKSTPLNFWRPWLLSKGSDKYNFLFRVGFLRTNIIFQKLKLNENQFHWWLFNVLTIVQLVVNSKGVEAIVNTSFEFRVKNHSFEALLQIAIITLQSGVLRN